MSLMRRYLDIVNEAKFAKPVVMFHGTSSALLRSILKNGMMPDPKKRSWDADPGASAHVASRKSLSGSYWTSNLITATSSAHRARQQFGGDSDLVVIARIMEGSASADEDNVGGFIEMAFGAMNRLLNPGISSEAVGLIALNYVENPETRSKMQRQFATALHEYLNGRDLQAIDRRLTDEVLDAFIMRKLSYGHEEYWLSKLETPLKLPSPHDAEARFLRAKERLTKSYRYSVYKKHESFNHTLRMTQPIGFRGANRIIGIVELPDYREINGRLRAMPLILHYGRMPQEFLEQYEARKGVFPGLLDPQGNVLIARHDTKQYA